MEAAACRAKQRLQRVHRPAFELAKNGEGVHGLRFLYRWARSRTVKQLSFKEPPLK